MREIIGTMAAFSRVSQTQYWTEAIGFHLEPTAGHFLALAAYAFGIYLMNEWNA